MDSIDDIFNGAYFVSWNLEGWVKYVTEKAILITTKKWDGYSGHGQHDYWLPKSQIKIDYVEEKANKTTFYAKQVPDWLLEPKNQK
jgi:hypothetical protein